MNIFALVAEHHIDQNVWGMNGFSKVGSKKQVSNVKGEHTSLPTIGKWDFSIVFFPVIFVELILLVG